MSDTNVLAPIRRFFSVVAQPRTYLNVAYIWLAFPLGLLYFVVLVTGSALSLGLSLLWIGLFLMVGVFLCVWSLILFERVLSKWFLGESFPVLQRASTNQTAWQWLRATAVNRETWKGVLFLLLKFPIGLACWVASIVSFAVSAALISAPLQTYDVTIDMGVWFIEDPTGGWLLSAAGVLLFLVTLHAHNVMGALWKFLAKQLLSVSQTVPPASGDLATPEGPMTQELQPA